jgi:histidinol dehydrogenase
VAAVRRNGDVALRAYARQLDGLGAREPLFVDPSAIRAARTGVDESVRRAIRAAAANIERVARAEMPVSRVVRPAPGVSIELRASPIGRVGCYVPGGRNPLISSLLMTAIPARVAGVASITIACPRPVPALLYAARVAGVSRVLRAGGAQAIAALAYGTETITPVDKIVGPGNAYVAAAKALVAADCAIDFYAGPTELVVVSVAGNPEWIAADLLAQAEHDPDARTILITPNGSLASDVAVALARELRAKPSGRGGTSPRHAAEESIRRNCAAIVTSTIREAIAIAEHIAPEHVACDDDQTAAALQRAGTIFVGGHSVPALGDYATGSNHVLPTAGAARARGGLSAADFVKITAVQRLTARGVAELRDAAVTLARAEGLDAHARSIEVRL